MDFKFPYTDYHELNLDWFLAEFKKLTADWLQLQHDWEDEQQAFQDLHDYVQDYFANLNLYQEVHDILYSDEMQQTIQLMLTNISASQLPTVVANQIASVVASQLAPVVVAQLPNLLNSMLPSFLPDAVAGEASAWLADHVDPATGYVIDDTLTIALAAADAAAVGDRFDEVDTTIDGILKGSYTTNPTMTTETAVRLSTGSIATLSGYTEWASTDRMTIPPNCTKIITNINNALGLSDQMGYAFYGEDLAFIASGHFPVYNSKEFISEIPVLPTYKYIRMTNYNADSDHTGLYVIFYIGTSGQLKITTDIANSDHDDLTHSIATTLEKTFITYNADDKIKYYNYATGKTSVCDVSQLVGKYVYITTKQISNTYKLMYAFYNNAGVCIAYRNGLSSGDEILTNFEVKVPNDAQTLIVNGRIAEDQDITVRNIDAMKEYPARQLKDKHIVTYGDSLTWYDTNEFTWGPEQGTVCIGFQSYLREKMGMITTNRGASGETTVQICNRIVNAADLSAYNYMIIMGGDNDDRLGTPIGTLQPVGGAFDTTTLYGALQNAIETALTVNPDLRIILMTQPMGWTYQNGAMDRVSDLIPAAYRNVAALYGIPLIDLWSESGINELTRADYYLDPSVGNTDYMYHPNNKGWRRLSAIICQKIKDL